MSHLEVWKKSHELTLKVYKITRNFPSNEIYGITSQIKRSSSSIAANIIEGQSRQHTKEFIQFLYIAKGSVEETHYFLLLSKDLEYISQIEFDELEKLCISIKMMLNKLITVLKSKKRES